MSLQDHTLEFYNNFNNQHMINKLNLKKIFCWVHKGNSEHFDKDGKTTVLPHGLAMGEDGVMLAITPAMLPSTIMPELSRFGHLYDDHFGPGEWELCFVPECDVNELGKNLDFECAMSKNQLLAAQAGL